MGEDLESDLDRLLDNTYNQNIMWFKKLVGFEEITPNQVRENLTIDGEFLISKINNKKYRFGKLEVPTLAELRSLDLESYDSKISIEEIVRNVRNLHQEKKNATFQAASQFNLLEMASPDVTPELGVDIYENDYTQGPACAIACGAGTIYRNYFAKLKNQIGQSRSEQIDCLEEFGEYFNNAKNKYWEMENGYAFVNKEGLRQISKTIKNLDNAGYEALKAKLKIGLQINTEVTISEENHTVTQVYCSAFPIGYSRIGAEEWEAFARLVLEASYEATFYAALKNYEATGNNELYLTLVGGGVFANPLTWILEAIEKSVAKFKHTPLDVKVVSYGRSNQRLHAFLKDLSNKM